MGAVTAVRIWRASHFCQRRGALERGCFFMGQRLTAAEKL